MFGKTAKPKPAPKPVHQVVGHLAADALLGHLTMDVSTGYGLVATFKKYNGDTAEQAQALNAFADHLVAVHPAVAARLVDLLAERVGR